MAASNSSTSKNSPSGDEHGEQAAHDDRADDTQPPSYEEARDELVEVVRRLEAGGTTLEESLTLWERGEELARICQSWLQGARERLARAERQGEQDTADNDAEER